MESVNQLYKTKVDLAYRTLNKLSGNHHFIEGEDIINSLVVKGRPLEEISKNDMFKEARRLLYDKNEVAILDDLERQGTEGVRTSICRGCEEDLPESAFHIVRGGRGNRYPDSLCKKCRHAQQKERYWSDPVYREKKKKMSREYHRKRRRTTPASHTLNQ